MQSPKSVFFACENSFCIEYQMVRNVIIGRGFFAAEKEFAEINKIPVKNSVLSKLALFILSVFLYD